MIQLVKTRNDAEPSMPLRLAAHAAGAAAAWILFCIEAGVLYIGLLASAIVSGQDLGGPFAGPFMVLAAAVGGAVVTLMVLLPAVLISRLAGRLRCPVAFVLAGPLLIPVVAVPAAATGLSGRDAVTVWTIVSGGGVVPLAVWCAIVTLGSRPHRGEEDDDVALWAFDGTTSREVRAAANRSRSSRSADRAARRDHLQC
jgi:hypothetical protein